MAPERFSPELTRLLATIPEGRWEPRTPSPGTNLLLQADNLLALKHLLINQGLAKRIDLIYLDPPFATRNVFSLSAGRANTISSSKAGTTAYRDTLTGKEYLAFLRARLLLLRELLSPQGSIYLHIDYKVGHYVKVLMDEVFGIENFRSDISRVKCNPKNFPRKGYGNIKDMILFYSKSQDLIWNEPYEPYTEEDLKRLFPKKDADGRAYTTIPLHAPGETQNGKTAQPFRGMLPPEGRHWRSEVAVLEAWDAQGLIEWSKNGNPRKKIYADERKGKRMQDIWEFKDPQYPVYPTEKNADLLEFIIRTSSLPSSTVLDCFCGSGTTLLAAEKLGRSWIGIDASDLAVEQCQHKLNQHAGAAANWRFVKEQSSQTSP